MGISVDSTDCLRAWAESLGGITYHLLSDFFPHGRVAELFGVLRPEGYSERAIFVVDKEGLIRYVDVHDIDDQPDNEVLFSILAGLEPAAAAEYQQREQQSLSSALPDVDVVIYCTPWCPDCSELRQFLLGCQAQFTEVDISRNPAAAKLVREWCGGKEVTPVVKIRGSEVIVEFDRPRIEAALAKLFRS